MMPGYIKKLLQKYKHCMPSKPQHCPYLLSPKQYHKKEKGFFLVNIFHKLSPEEIKDIQCFVGSMIFYVRAVNITILMELSSIAIKQTKGTTNTMAKAN
jgi:hypothetical protein